MSTNASNNNHRSSRWYEGLAGLGPNFNLFKSSPPWVDESLPPGQTSQAPSLSNNNTNQWWLTSLLGLYIIYSGNLIWLMIALAIYVIFPYDFDVAKEFDEVYGKWIAQRAFLNLSIIYIYYGFWHMTLYCLGWSDRPFNSNRGLRYRWGKLIHNIWYTTLGTLQWTIWEAVMIHCYATGQVCYLSNEDAFSTSKIRGLVHFVFWTIAIPLYRDIHFYFAHRLIHVRALYAYVHSIHHRNTDVEPFSGLCMHPIEHLYYFTSIAPSLYFANTSPFVFLWNGIHLILSPGASHSGYEDHWESDQYHYLHHRFFECNYGSPSFLLDNVFGTFRDRLSTKSDTYRGDAEGVGSNVAAALDSKATLFGWPHWDQFLFNVVFCVCVPIVYARALIGSNGNNEFGNNLSTEILPALLVFGPIGGGMFLLLMKEGLASKNTLKWQLSYPFHNEHGPQLGMHILVGILLGVYPAFTLFRMALISGAEESV